MTGILVPIFLLIAGLAILILGGEVFVRGAAGLAKKMSVSPIVIGLTVVSFGTSAPELVVNIFSAVQGAPDIAIGNILGSNISNILLVLGVAATIKPLTVKKNTTWKEIPFGILAVVMLWALVNDLTLGNGGVNMLTRGDGIVLMGFFFIFLYYTFGLGKAEADIEADEGHKMLLSRSLLYIIMGIGFLVFGGKLIVDNGILLARMAGLSELFIGLTFVAIGTSLPELATSAIAAYRGHVDLAIGNVVGSNIFNILWILGLTPIIAPLPVGTTINFDIFMAALAAALLFLFLLLKKKGHRHTLKRWEGLVFIMLYLIYIVFVALRG